MSGSLSWKLSFVLNAHPADLYWQFADDTDYTDTAGLA